MLMLTDLGKISISQENAMGQLCYQADGSYKLVQLVCSLFAKRIKFKNNNFQMENNLCVNISGSQKTPEIINLALNAFNKVR